jgi:hypothetical protein
MCSENDVLHDSLFALFVKGRWAEQLFLGFFKVHDELL